MNKIRFTLFLLLLSFIPSVVMKVIYNLPTDFIVLNVLPVNIGAVIGCAALSTVGVSVFRSNMDINEKLKWISIWTFILVVIGMWGTGK